MKEPRIGSIVRTQLGEAFQRHLNGWWNASSLRYQEAWTWRDIISGCGEPIVLFEPEEPEPPVGSILEGTWDEWSIPTVALHIDHDIWELTGSDSQFTWKVLTERLNPRTIIREGY